MAFGVANAALLSCTIHASIPLRQGGDDQVAHGYGMALRRIDLPGVFTFQTVIESRHKLQVP